MGFHRDIPSLCNHIFTCGSESDLPDRFINPMMITLPHYKEIWIDPNEPKFNSRKDIESRLKNRKKRKKRKRRKRYKK